MLLMEMVAIYLSNETTEITHVYEINMFDLHCDTITKCLEKKCPLDQNDLHIDLTRGSYIQNWIQTFAFWIDDSYQGESAFNRFLSQYSLLQSEMERLGLNRYTGGEKSANRCNIIMAIEGGHVLGGDISKIAQLKEMGIFYLTLVWNSDNELGCGYMGGHTGLTDFGKAAVLELERSGITVDVSHLNESGFYDVCSIATKPILATHSNSWEVHKHPRNLKDDQLKYIIDNNGLCGINFYPLFVTGETDCTLDDLKKHIDHILTLGGEDVLAIGSDFDGAPMPTVLNDISKIGSFYIEAVNWYGRAIADKIFFENAKKFIDKKLI